MEGEVVHVSLKVENGRNKVTVVNLVHITKERGASTAERRLKFFGFFFFLGICMGFWRRKWQPTPVLLPGESQGRGSLVGCRLWGCTESDTTEVT